MRDAAPNTFEIGLVMAGAASAGAYTAGVIDFLLEALAEWQQAKATGDPEIPGHEVCIRVAAGASAGGIMAALLGMVPFVGHTPMRTLAASDNGAMAAGDVEGATQNLFYRAWVLGTDLADMLATDDLGAASPRIPSLLNARPLAAVAADVVADVRAALASGTVTPPGYFANPLQLMMALTNMEGLPYTIQMKAAEGLCGHRVRCHADHAHFAVLGAGSGPEGPVPAAAIAINAPGTAGLPDTDGWDRLHDAALATSAFPAGFPARRFRNEPGSYQHRPRFVRAVAGTDAGGFSLDLPGCGDDGVWFWSIDGGLLDNEPIEHARLALYGSLDSAEQRDGRTADRAILLIDAFPNAGPIRPSAGGPEPDMLDCLFSLLPILREQASFRPQDLALALCESVHSRYLLTPVRDTCCGAETALASAGLGGFAGFIGPRLRMHDFQLGRRNCQKFLRDHFRLPADNPLVTRRSGRPRACFGDPGPLPIIPLIGTAAIEVPLLSWPQLDRFSDLAPLQKLIRSRAEAVVPELLRSLLHRLGVQNGRLLSRILKGIACDMITDRVAGAAFAALERDIVARGLVSG